jgi:hypothetical protein
MRMIVVVDKDSANKSLNSKNRANKRRKKVDALDGNCACGSVGTVITSII